ncbi:Cytochrome c oxidase subunit NDUFA4 [Manis javanica]|nr:Cytochrome c oxidase subunit NDUFA4 [Manis javanica]
MPSQFQQGLGHEWTSRTYEHQEKMNFDQGQACVLLPLTTLHPGGCPGASLCVLRLGTFNPTSCATKALLLHKRDKKVMDFQSHC